MSRCACVGASCGCETREAGWRTGGLVLQAGWGLKLPARRGVDTLYERARRLGVRFQALTDRAGTTTIRLEGGEPLDARAAVRALNAFEKAEGGAWAC